MFHVIGVINCRQFSGSRDSSVGTAKTFGLIDESSITGRSKEISSFGLRFPSNNPVSTGEEIGRDLKVITRLHLLPRWKMVELCLHFPTRRLHDLVLN
jgi:hypothetical protein